MKIFEVPKNEAEIKRGLILIGIEGSDFEVESVTKLISQSYPSTNCSDVGDKEGNVIEYFCINRSDKPHFINLYKKAKFDLK
jgi:hypothetical protein